MSGSWASRAQRTKDPSLEGKATEGNAEARFIGCTYSAGMFRNEYAVTIEAWGTEFTLFADHDDLKITDPDAGRGLLRVEVWDREKGVIQLPAETMEQGRRFLRYPLDELRSA